MSDDGRPKSGPDQTGELLARGLAPAGAWVPPAAESLAEAFPGLRVRALAGRGGMGAVYRAEQTRLGRTVAVKILPPGVMPDPMAQERFEREARVLSEIDHPHVMRIYDFGALADGTLYLVSEWAEGGDLAKLLGEQAHPAAKVCEWVGQIAGALDAAHAKGVVHRDLKPANVLVRADGKLALADFGLAYAQGAGFTTALTMSGTIFGTFDYMAPEQMGTDMAITPATDVYALGVMTYLMLTGRLPRGVFVRASRLVQVPAAVDALIDSALANEPGRRPRTAGEFGRRLTAACAERGKRKRLGWILGGGVLAVTVAFGVSGRVGESERGEASPSPAPLPTRPAMREDAPTANATAQIPEEIPPATSQIPAEIAPILTPIPEPPTVPASPPATSPAVVSAPAETATPWTWLLPSVRPAQNTANGGWTLRGGELVSDAAVCALRLPVTVPANNRYDVAVEFTRTAGRNSVGVFLPTSSGAGVFELDAWDQGLGGIQMINGQDMRAHGEHFPATLRNGERVQLILQVRGARVEALVNGVSRRSWDLTGRSFSNNRIWEAGADMKLGLCSWRSPTIFHRVAYRVVQ